MAEIIWPDSPILGQIYTSDNGDQWEWNGYAWDALGSNVTHENFYNLPTPKVYLEGEKPLPFAPNTITTYDPIANATQPGSITLGNCPFVTAQDLTLDQITQGVWVEMVVFRRKRNRKSGYIVPPPYSYREILGVPDPHNALEDDIGMPLITRGGFHTTGNPAVLVKTNRPNHIKVSSINETIDVWSYLNGRFIDSTVEYRDTSGVVQTLGCVYPISRYSGGGTRPTSRFAYSPVYTPMYIAFRYIMWDSTLNNGLGQFAVGPMSKVVKIAAETHPFVYDPAGSFAVGLPTCTINPLYDKTRLNCWFETRLP